MANKAFYYCVILKISNLISCFRVIYCVPETEESFLFLLFDAFVIVLVLVYDQGRYVCPCYQLSTCKLLFYWGNQ